MEKLFSLKVRHVSMITLPLFPWLNNQPAWPKGKLAAKNNSLPILKATNGACVRESVYENFIIFHVIYALSQYPHHSSMDFSAKAKTCSGRKRRILKVNLNATGEMFTHAVTGRSSWKIFIGILTRMMVP